MSFLGPSLTTLFDEKEIRFIVHMSVQMCTIVCKENKTFLLNIVLAENNYKWNKCIYIWSNLNKTEITGYR